MTDKDCVRLHTTVLYSNKKTFLLGINDFFFIIIEGLNRKSFVCFLVVLLTINPFGIDVWWWSAYRNRE